MKTAITVLQEMMMKFKEVPAYEFLAQSGPQHLSTFKYRCTAQGEVSVAVARSKKEAKQEAARLILQKLAERGESVPPPFGLGAEPAPALDTRSYVALLKDLCEEYRLPAVNYELVGDTGPPHQRRFTVRACIGQHTRLATDTTKKAARQQAAEALYHYLRENLRLSNDFVEEEALVRAHERAMDRYIETRAECSQRPRLDQRVADFHLGLQQQFDEEKRTEALEALSSTGGQPGLVSLACVASVLGLEVSWSQLPCEPGPPLELVHLTPTSPQLVYGGNTREEAAATAARFLTRGLTTRRMKPASPAPVDLLA